jgi:uncharacterized protein (TIGR03000 family)
MMAVPVVPAEAVPVAPNPVNPPAKAAPEAGKKVGQAPVSATVVVRLPAEAKLYANGQLTRLADAERKFVTPALQPGVSYHYELKVEAVVDGRPVTETRRVDVAAGQRYDIDFGSMKVPAEVAAK